MKKCSVCGKILDNDSEFCSSCGGKAIQASFAANPSLSEETPMNKRVSSDTSENVSGMWVLHSSEPLPNELAGIKKVYIVIVAIILIGAICSETLLGIGFLALLCWYGIDYGVLLKNKWYYLRKEEFKFISGVTYDEVFDALQPRLISKYGSSMQVLRTESGSDRIVRVQYDNMLYDIYLEDSVFRIRWGMNFTRAFLSFTDYRDYKKTLVAMGMIGYELQQAFNIT
jgi:hypothetical protein